MFVWHREELLVTVSTEYYLRVRALLQQNDIKMQCRQVRIRHHGKQEMLQKPLAQYHIYVHKEDLERASQLVQQIGPEEDATVEYLEW
ncbi:MAG: hypothetical protein II197_07025 [Peptococcaceae bacterium]|jgi:hypothetical protein|nr:hypothetical protein [Peptococcaceae bacterium]